DDCVLQIVSADGASTHTGAAQVLDALVSLSAQAPAFGHLEAAITHGKAAAAWGHWQQSADGEDPRHFSHTMWFTTHKAQAFGQIRIFQTCVDSAPAAGPPPTAGPSLSRSALGSRPVPESARPCSAAAVPEPARPCDSGQSLCDRARACRSGQSVPGIVAMVAAAAAPPALLVPA